MKSKISICFLTIVIILLVLFILEKINTGMANDKKDQKVPIQVADTQPAAQKSDDSLATSKELTGSEYIIKNDSGMLSVYKSSGTEKFFDTGVYFDELPFDIQQKVNAGIGFESETDLYDFLESYSS